MPFKFSLIEGHQTLAKIIVRSSIQWLNLITVVYSSLTENKSDIPHQCYMCDMREKTQISRGIRQESTFIYFHSKTT